MRNLNRASLSLCRWRALGRRAGRARVRTRLSWHNCAAHALRGPAEVAEAATADTPTLTILAFFIFDPLQKLHNRFEHSS